MAKYVHYYAYKTCLCQSNSFFNFVHYMVGHEMSLVLHSRDGNVLFVTRSTCKCIQQQTKNLCSPCHLVLEQKRRLSLFKNIEEENIRQRTWMPAAILQSRELRRKMGDPWLELQKPLLCSKLSCIHTCMQKR